MSPAVLIPWCLLAGALAVGVWMQRRYAALVGARARTAAALQDTEATLHRISQAVESATDAIGIGDMAANSVYHNRAHQQMFGYSVDELNAVEEPATLFADKTVAKSIHESIRGGRSWAGETEVKTKDGRRIPAFVRADVIRDQTGNPVGIFGVFTDITERRRIEHSLDVERQRLAITLQSIADGVITVDSRGRVERMNRVAEQLTGWRQNEAERMPLATVLALFDENTRAPRLPVAANLRDTVSPLPEADCILVMRDGRERIVAEKTTALVGPQGLGGGSVVVFRDVTDERRRAEEKEQADKLESLGLLAGGIAHDFNNVLTVIVGHLSLLDVASDVPDPVRERLRSIEKATWRARGLTEQLLTFAKGSDMSKKIIQLQPIVRESVAFAVSGAPEVVVHVEQEESLWPLEADPTQLGQVVNNIALNAVQAMNRRGILRVTAQNHTLESAKGVFPAGARVVHLAISDTGSGISPENLRKIFDPFFTTKKDGTGLGLATVYAIVRRHGGRMEVESELGQGTTFHVWMPAANPAPGPRRTKPPFAIKLPDDAKRVLVMDDDSGMRDMLSSMLRAMNYEVETANDGWQATELFVQARQEGRGFQAVVFDLRVAHGLGGAETVRRLRRFDPDLKAIAVSGYPDDPVMTHFRRNGFDAAVAKPFGVEDLRDAIRPLIAV